MGIRGNHAMITCFGMACDIQCIIWVPASSVVSVRYSGPLWDVA